MKNNFAKSGIVSIMLAIPHFRKERESVRKQIKEIVAQYVPQIRRGLVEYENRQATTDELYSYYALNLLNSEAAEEYGKANEKLVNAWDNVKKLCWEMMVKLGDIPHYNRYFCRIENPATMRISYGFGHSTEYCAHLIQVFGSSRKS